MMSTPGAVTPGTVTPGLRWGIKRSFIDYVARMPDGRMSVTDGASADNAYEVFWEHASARVEQWTDADRLLAFRGDVRYGGHGGLLFVQLADPWIALRGDIGEMSVGNAFGDEPGARLSLVTFRVVETSADEDGFDVISAGDVTLTTEGTSLFNDVYKAGEAFEPLTLTLPQDP